MAPPVFPVIGLCFPSKLCQDSWDPKVAPLGLGALFKSTLRVYNGRVRSKRKPFSTL